MNEISPGDIVSSTIMYGSKRRWMLVTGTDIGRITGYYSRNGKILKTLGRRYSGFELAKQMERLKIPHGWIPLEKAERRCPHAEEE